MTLAINEYTSPIIHGERASTAMIRESNGREHILICRGGKLEARVGEIRKMSEKTIAKVRASGESLVRNDGAIVWRERRTMFDPSGSSSSKRYTWNEEGDKVRAQWFEVVQYPDGTTQDRKLRSVWVPFENL